MTIKNAPWHRTNKSKKKIEMVEQKKKRTVQKKDN